MHTNSAYYGALYFIRIYLYEVFSFDLAKQHSLVFKTSIIWIEIFLSLGISFELIL